MADGRADRDFSDFTLEKREKAKAYSRAPERDTDSIEVISDGGGVASVGFRIPPAGRDPAASREMRRVRTSNYSSHGARYDRVSRGSGHSQVQQGDAAERTQTRAQPEERVLAEYGSGGPFIRHVTVKSWPGGYSFYEKFARDAVISHSKRGEAVPHVPFFSYIPQYSQLSAAGFAYYLYMKEQLRLGVRLPDADFSYVLLYIYEIINLEGIISPTEGAELLAAAWVLYRPMHPSLDRYMSEWMADYCLVYNVPLPSAVMRILSEVGARSSLKEFFADAAMRQGIPIGRMIRLSLSDYNPERSRCAATIPDFASQVEEVFDGVIDEQARRGEGLFSEKSLREMSITRDAFCGSLCASNIKKRITVKLKTPFRSPDARRIVTEMMKGSENVVRARHGVKARLNAPPVTGKTPATVVKGEEETEYLSYYDSPAEPLSTARAAEIESQSWQNVSVLTDGEDVFSDVEEVAGAISTEDVRLDGDVNIFSEDAAETVVDPTAAIDGVPDSFASAVGRDPLLAEALRCAMNGGGFASFCRKHGLFADDAAMRINEAAMEHIGDVVLEMHGTDYAFVEDYREDARV